MRKILILIIVSISVISYGKKDKHRGHKNHDNLDQEDTQTYQSENEDTLKLSAIKKRVLRMYEERGLSPDPSEVNRISTQIFNFKKSIDDYNKVKENELSD